MLAVTFEIGGMWEEYACPDGCRPFSADTFAASLTSACWLGPTGRQTRVLSSVRTIYFSRPLVSLPDARQPRRRRESRPRRLCPRPAIRRHLPLPFQVLDLAVHDRPEPGDQQFTPPPPQPG